MNRRNWIFMSCLIMLFLFTMGISLRKSSLNQVNTSRAHVMPYQASNTVSLPIGIFYDGNYSEPWNFNAKLLTSYLNTSLRSWNLTVFVLNATELRNFMEMNPLSIVIITMGIAPETIWNGSENSFIETWLDNGGILVWTGCQEFYWIGYESGQNIPVGDIGAVYVLDMEYIQTISNQYVYPTSFGMNLFSNFSAHTTDVFASISALDDANVYYEVYAKKGDWGDPILFQPRGGKGYFVRIHADWNDQLPIQNLSTWISSYIYQRFFKLPLITDLSSIQEIYFLSSGEFSINITNFSENYNSVYINSSSDAFSLINMSVIMPSGTMKRVSFFIQPLDSARFQQYIFQINLFCNYTNLQNSTQILQIYSQRFYITIQVPISIDNFTKPEKMYSGSTYVLSFTIQKHINDTFNVEIILIGKGYMNEIKTSIYLKENKTEFQIMFSIQMMAKSGSYELLIRIYHNDVLFLDVDTPIQILSIFQNPWFQTFPIVLSVILFSLLGFFLIQRKRRKVLESEIISILKSKNIIFLKKLAEILKIKEKKIQKYVKSCIRRSLIDGYLVRNEKQENLYIQKAELQNFILTTISKMKSTDLYQIAKTLNLNPEELEIILSSHIELTKL